MPLIRAIGKLCWDCVNSTLSFGWYLAWAALEMLREGCFIVVVGMILVLVYSLKVCWTGLFPLERYAAKAITLNSSISSTDSCRCTWLTDAVASVAVGVLVLRFFTSGWSCSDSATLAQTCCAMSRNCINIIWAWVFLSIDSGFQLRWFLIPLTCLSDFALFDPATNINGPETNLSTAFPFPADLVTAGVCSGDCTRICFHSIVGTSNRSSYNWVQYLTHGAGSLSGGGASSGKRLRWWRSRNKRISRMFWRSRISGGWRVRRRRIWYALRVSIGFLKSATSSW